MTDLCQSLRPEAHRLKGFLCIYGGKMADKLFNPTSQWFQDELGRINAMNNEIIDLKNLIIQKQQFRDEIVLKTLSDFAPTVSLQKALARELFMNDMCSIGVIATALNVPPDNLIDLFPTLKGKVILCPECNEPMINDNRECCDECTLKKMPYQEYLISEHWQNVRRESLIRADYRCQLCNSKGQLHVHHRTYENRGEETSLDVIVLCANCHAKFHDKLSE